MADAGDSWLDSLLEKLSPSKKRGGDAEGGGVRKLDEAGEAPKQEGGDSANGTAGDAGVAEAPLRTNSVEDLASKLARQAEDFSRDVGNLVQSIMGKDKTPPSAPAGLNVGGSPAEASSPAKSSSAKGAGAAGAAAVAAASPSPSSEENKDAASAASPSPFLPQLALSAQEAHESFGSITRAMSAVTDTIARAVSSVVDGILGTVSRAACWPEAPGGKYPVKVARRAAEEVMNDMVRAGHPRALWPMLPRAPTRLTLWAAGSCRGVRSKG